MTVGDKDAEKSEFARESIESDGGKLIDDSDADGDSRTGFLSTYTEFHVSILGFAAGVGLSQVSTEAFIGLIAAVVGIKGANKYADLITEEVRDEPWYFIGFALLGFVFARLATRLTQGPTPIV